MEDNFIDEPTDITWIVIIFGSALTLVSIGVLFYIFNRELVNEFLKNLFN